MNGEQNKRLHMLLTQCGLLYEKGTLVLSFTNGRTSHSSEMNFREAGELINHLHQYGKKTETNSEQRERENKMRRKILSICHQLGWYLRDSNNVLILKNNMAQIDLKRVDDWCVKYSHLHKKLNDHSAKELVMLVSQFDQVLVHHLKK